MNQLTWVASVLLILFFQIWRFGSPLASENPPAALSDEFIGLIYESQDGHLVQDFLGSQRIALGNNRVQLLVGGREQLVGAEKYSKSPTYLFYFAKNPSMVSLPFCLLIPTNLTQFL